MNIGRKQPIRQNSKYKGSGVDVPGTFKIARKEAQTRKNKATCDRRQQKEAGARACSILSTNLRLNFYPGEF